MLKRCISSKNFEETCYVYSVSSNIEICMGSDTNEVIDKLIDTMLQKFQETKKTSFEKGSELIFENVDFLYYYFHGIDMRRCRSYIEIPKSLKNEKATINPEFENNSCLQYAVPAA